MKVDCFPPGRGAWNRLEDREILTYAVYGVDTTEALYLEDCEENIPPARNSARG